jgi:hypothetical protein
MPPAQAAKISSTTFGFLWIKVRYARLAASGSPNASFPFPKRIDRHSEARRELRLRQGKAFTDGPDVNAPRHIDGSGACPGRFSIKIVGSFLKSFQDFVRDV